MKAAVHRRFGPPDVVTVGDEPKPVPRDDEVLVQIHAATVGVVDSVARRGTPFYSTRATRCGGSPTRTGTSMKDARKGTSWSR
jgi:NADPH:quinone reductase-like Zn-dependent oxidoreductase